MSENKIQDLPEDFGNDLRHLAYWSIYGNPVARKTSVTSPHYVKLINLRTVVLEGAIPYQVLRGGGQV